MKWERNDQVNVGIDFGILNGRVRFTADWYNKVSKDILLELAQPTHMGFSSLLLNSGEIKNTGVEFTISADPYSTKDFSWHTDVTLSHNKGIFNKIQTRNHRQQQAGEFQNQLFQMIEGEKLGTFWGYTFEECHSSNGIQHHFRTEHGSCYPDARLPEPLDSHQPYRVPGRSVQRTRMGADSSDRMAKQSGVLIRTE